MQIAVTDSLLFPFLRRALRATEENLELQDLRSVPYFLFFMYLNGSVCIEETQTAQTMPLLIL